MGKKSLMVQVVCLKELDVNVNNFLIMETGSLLLKPNDLGLAYSFVFGDCMLPRARNTGIKRFLDSPATDLIMMDDDNWGDAGTFEKLLSHDVDVVAAPCRAKNPEMKWPIRFFRDRPVKRAENGLLEVETVGTGIIRMTRKAVTDMIAAQPDHWYHDDQNFPGQKVPALFEYVIKDHQFWGEDVSFCKKYQAIGGKVWVDPDIKTYHRGPQTFEGSVGEWLKNMPKTLSISDPVAVPNEFAA